MCLCLMLVACAPSAPAPIASPTLTRPAPSINAPTQPAGPPGGPAPTATGALPRPGAPTVSAAATRAIQARAADQPLAVVEWWVLAYRGARGAEVFQPLTQAFSDQVRLSGGVRGVLGVGPDDMREVNLRFLPGATADQAQVEARLSLTEGEVILLITLTHTPEGWRISRVDTIG